MTLYEYQLLKKIARCGTSPMKISMKVLSEDSRLSDAIFELERRMQVYTYKSWGYDGRVYVYVYITDKGHEALRSHRDWIANIVMLAAVLGVLLVILTSCRPQRELIDSNVNHSQSTQTQNYATERRDSVVYRDSISYVERIKNDTVYVYRDRFQWRYRDVLKFDSIYIYQTDTAYIERVQKETTVKQPTFWQKLKSGIWIAFVILLTLGMGYVVCRIMIKK